MGRWISPALLILSFLIPQVALAQSDTASVLTDTTVVFPTPSQDIPRQGDRPDDATTFRHAKNPWIAVGLSALLPGAGQVYAENYWKVPVIWSLGGYWVYEWIRQNDRYRDFRERFQESITPQSPQGNQQFLRLRDFYRDERDKFAWYIGLLYLLNLVDAYVGASLYDFDVGPDLGLDGRPVPRVTATIRIQW